MTLEEEMQNEKRNIFNGLENFIIYLIDKFGFIFSEYKKQIWFAIACMSVIATPFVIWWHVITYPDNFGGTVCLIFILSTMSFVFYQISRWYAGGMDDEMPIPRKRFTKYDLRDGMVHVDNDRLQEMILYMADLEDFLHDNGRL